VTRRERAWLVGIVAVAAALRLAWVVWATRQPVGLHDPTFYLIYGDALATGHGYRLFDLGPTAYYPPGYPLSLAPAFWLLRHTPLPDDGQAGAAALLNVAWQLLLVVVVFRLGRSLTGRASGGLVAAGVIAVWPNLVFHSGVALTESLFLLLLAVALLLVVEAPWGERRFESWRLVALGGVLGAGALVRPITPPLVVVVGVALLVAGAGWRRALSHAGVVAACLAAVVLPWVVRNAVVMDAVTFSTNTGDNLCMSRYPGGSGGFVYPNPRCLPERFDRMRRPESETARDAHGRRLAIEFVREHPLEEVRLIGRRLVETFSDDADGVQAVESYGTDPWLGDGTRRGLRWGATTYGLLAGLASLPGLWVLARRSPPGLAVVLTGAVVLLPPLVFFGDPRFHVPAVPVAAVGIGVATDAWRRSRAAGRPTTPAS